MKITDFIEEVKRDGEKTTTKDLADFVTDVFGSATTVVSGAANTVRDLADNVKKLSEEDFSGVINSANDRVQNMVKGTKEVVESGLALTNAVTESITRRKSIEGGEKATSEDIVSFAKDVVVDSATGVVSGAVNTISDIAGGVSKLSEGDFGGAFNIANNRVQNMVKGTIGIVESGVALTSSAAESITTGETFITPENKAHLTNLCRTGIYAAIGSAMLIDDDPTGTTCPGNDACLLPGVENGVFVGDSEDLNSLIKAGEQEGTEHISSVDRSDSARTDFLNSHGIVDTDGWDVHHIVPVSEGGPDDSHNMVLISPEDHDQITKDQAEFYGWHKKS